MSVWNVPGKSRAVVMTVSGGKVDIAGGVGIQRSMTFLTQNLSWALMKRVRHQKDNSAVYVQSARLYRVIHKSHWDFRTRLPNNHDRHGRKEHINR